MVTWKPIVIHILIAIPGGEGNGDEEKKKYFVCVLQWRVFQGEKEGSFCLSLREIIAIALDVQYSISSTWNERGGDDDDRW